MDVTLWFDPETAEAEVGKADYDPPTATWKVIRQGDAISILARNAKGKVVLIASGTWSGKGIGGRNEIGETVTDSQWGKLANVILKAEAGEDLGVVQRREVEIGPNSTSEPRRPLVDYTGPEGVTPGATASTPKPGNQPKGSSGWWVFGAGVAAGIGAVISWKAEQPYDSGGRAITVALGILAAVLLGYSIYGGATRCPSCHAWYKRKKTGRDEAGTSTESREETTSVKDSAGNVVGSTSQYVTYHVTRYNHHYSCRACSHRWTLQSSSRSRA